MDFHPLRDALGERLRFAVPMREYTSFRIGGPAAALYEPSDAAELICALNAAQALRLPVFVMGNGTNLLVSDKGIDALVIRLGEAMSSVSVCGERVTAGAGALMSSVAKQSVAAGLMGLECLSGIPGSLGGAVAMNAGAYGAQVGDSVTTVWGVKDGELRQFDVFNGDFGYRFSSFAAPDVIVCAVELSLKRDDGTARARMAECTRARTEKQPLAYPSAGSVFKRPNGNFAGALIERAGLKGLSVGGAQVSELHAGFIINRGNATCEDVLELIYRVQKAVFDEFGVMLETEIKHIGG
ncbi:MAG: UDP-N-acetylmuramate dehydrogenase [Clostridia bacterium]|nr:UDP-N-acetylmuramate dehydrogenase [Clostridia bacterium]